MGSGRGEPIFPLTHNVHEQLFLVWWVVRGNTKVGIGLVNFQELVQLQAARVVPKPLLNSLVHIIQQPNLFPGISIEM